MKRVMVFHHFGGMGGAGKSLIDIILSIDYLSYDVTVVCPNNPNDMVNLIKSYGIKVIETTSTPINFAHYNGGIKNFLSIKSCLNLFKLIKDASKIEKIISENNPEIVIVNSMTLFHIGKIAKKRNIKTICFHRETYLKGLFGVRSNLIKRGLSNYFDKVVFISKYDLDQSKSVETKKVVIYDKVNDENYQNLDSKEWKKRLCLDEKDKYILYLGGFSRLKGAHIIVRAMKYIKDDRVKLIFVGNADGIKSTLKYRLRIDIYSKIKRIIKNLNLEERIMFFPETSTPEIFYSVADIIVFPSTKGHQARPIYESGFARKPLIISDFYQTKEFVTHEFNAILFKPESSIELSKAIEKCLNCNEFREHLIRNNYELAMKSHNFNTMKQEIKEVLKF